jgi:osmoprotectant transport system substrate-binding protein
MNRRSFLSVCAGCAALLLAGCNPRRNRVSIGSKNFTEQLILGEMLAQLVEARGPHVERRFYLAGSYICHQAILAGRIDTYVEYTGTALMAILKEPPASDPAAVFTTVKDEYARRFNLEVFPSLGFSNTFAIVMRGDDGRWENVKTLSGLSRVAPQMRMGVGYEFLERKDGFAGLAQSYNLHFAEPPRVMDLGLLYRALQSKQVDVVAGSNTDGLIAALGLVVLEDDRHYFPPYDAVPIVRPDALQRWPMLGDVLRGLAGKISADDVRRLNYEVDGEKKDATEVVRSYLRSHGLLQTGRLNHCHFDTRLA